MINRDDDLLRGAINQLFRERFYKLRTGLTGGRGGFTQVEFAEWLSISPSIVVNIENGKQGPTLSLLYRLAHKFSLNFDDLLPSVEEVSGSMREGELGLPEAWEEALSSGE